MEPRRLLVDRGGAVADESLGVGEDPRAGELADAVSGHVDPPQESRLQPPAQHVERRGHLRPVGGDANGGVGRGERAEISDEVGERDIDFVAHSRHDRYRRGEDRPHEHLFVETPEILEAAAAADQRDHVDGRREPGGMCQRRGQFLRRPRPLDPRRHDDHLGTPPPRKQGGEEIRDRRPRGARDHGDPSRECGNAPLAARGKEPLAFQ